MKPPERVAGTGAAAAGALFVAALAAAGGRADILLPVAVAGFGGAMADSLIGATVQARRWCERCRTETERMVHDCLERTSPLRGVAWLDNDLVNLAATIVGGLLAAVLAR